MTVSSAHVADEPVDGWAVFAITPSNARVIPFPRRTTWEPELTKRQIAQRLGYSTRWIEQRMGEGMPAGWRGSRRSFVESDVIAWLQANHAPWQARTELSDK